MSDYSAKPSGSLALDYAMSSDDSDEEEHITLTSKSTHNSTVEVNDVAVAEASPAEGGVESGSEPAAPSTAAVNEEAVPDDEPTEEEDEGTGRPVSKEEGPQNETKKPNEVQEEDPDDTPDPSREPSFESNSNEQRRAQDQDDSDSSAESSEDEDDDDEEEEDISQKKEESTEKEGVQVEEIESNNDKKQPEGNDEKQEENEEHEKEQDKMNSAESEAKYDLPAMEVSEASESGAAKVEVADNEEAGGSDESKPDSLDEKLPESSKRSDETSDDDSSDSDSNDDDDDDEEEDRDEQQTEERVEPMETSAAPEENTEEETTNGVKAEAPSNGENPWESPKQEPVDGIVQPRVLPPDGKPTRHTNCLDFVLFTVVKEALKHKHSWPFQTPVDTNKLEIPEYHNIVAKPMDLRTIERRLRNLYYWSAQDAIKDINQLFANCYAFNPPEYDVYKMAKTLEKQILSQLTELPRSDLNTLFENCKKFNDRNDDIYIMCENIEGVVQRGLEWMPTQERPADLADHHRRGMFPASTPSGKTKGPKQRGKKSTRGRKKAAVPRGAAAPKEEAMEEAEEDTSMKVEPLNFDDDDNVTEKDVESRAMSVQEEVEEAKPSTSQPAAKSNKRKAENGDNGVPVKTATPAAAAAVAVPPTPPPRKNPNTLIDWKSLVPRWHGKQSDWQKFCSKLLQEMHSIRNKNFAQIFYLPVDPIRLKIFDYLDVIKNPMDLQTIKKKLDYKQYAEPEEFEQDVLLMVNNCCTYNPKGSAVYQNAIDMKTFFESKWVGCPRPGIQPDYQQTLVVNTDLMEDEKINSYITAVKAEEKKCAEKLELLRNMSEGLYGIAMKRREAKLAGDSAPTLQDNQINQLDKLGITIKPIAPIMMPELVSPAVSVRSSGRAPVPKIIDDIGPSPIKSRKISKPRQSTASSVSVALTTPAARGRKKKSGRPRKSAFSPAASPPPTPVLYQPPPAPIAITPYVSIYGRKTVTRSDRVDLSNMMGNITVENITAILRIMQIGQHNSGIDIKTIRSMCDDEIDFNDVADDLVLEMLDFVQMIKVDKPRAEQVARDLEAKAKFYGFDDIGLRGPLAKRRKLMNQPPPQPPPQKDIRRNSDSPSPSASRSGNRSSDSESDSSDSEPSRENSVVRQVKRPILSEASSRASTPAGPSRAPPVATTVQPPLSRPAKSASFVAHKPVYPKRTLSESSSSSDGDRTSSDSSDSDSEPKQQIKKEPTPQKKKVLKKPAPPPPNRKKPAPLSILDELLPDTPGMKPKMATIPTVNSYTRNMPPESISLQKPASPPQMTEEQMRAQREHEHNEALRRQAEARRRRALQEEQPIIHQSEVMQAFESQYGDFSY